MPLQNRVTPYGSIVAIEERGTLMGNRGILHVNKQIFRPSMYNGWKTCLLDFNDNHRTVMRENSYTELFFLDEATAFSAGHRPCFECQRERFYKFRSCWIATNARQHKMIEPAIAKIDGILHKERINRKGCKVTYQDNALNVARGAFIDYEGKPYLKWGNNLFYEWTASGYVSAFSLPHSQRVRVLTPKSIVRCFKNGFMPKVHGSIDTVCLQLNAAQCMVSKEYSSNFSQIQLNTIINA